MIRRAQPEDIPGLISLLRLLFSIEEDFTFDAEKQHKGLSLLLQQQSSAIYLAKRDGETVGMITGQLLISTAEGGPALLVEDLVVSPDYRKKNIARTLIEHLSVWAKGKGANRMQLLADVNNIEALHFYEKCNWNRTQLTCLRKHIKA